MRVNRTIHKAARELAAMLSEFAFKHGEELSVAEYLSVVTRAADAHVLAVLEEQIEAERVSDSEND